MRPVNTYAPRLMLILLYDENMVKEVCLFSWCKAHHTIFMCWDAIFWRKKKMLPKVKFQRIILWSWEFHGCSFNGCWDGLEQKKYLTGQKSGCLHRDKNDAWIEQKHVAL